MKITLAGYLLVAMLSCSSCIKDIVFTTSDKTITSGIADNLSKVKKTKWGVLTSSVEFDNEQQIKITKSLDVKYVRTAICMDTWNGSYDKEYDAFKQEGYKILLNISQNSKAKEQPEPWTKDTSAWRKFVVSVLKKYKPELVAVDNEEINDNCHIGPPDQYFKLLRIVIQEAHKRNLKVTNGGLPVFTEKKSHFNPYYTSTLKQYKKMNLDYVNFHCKYPLDSTLEYMLSYMYKTCGYKTLITNECGMFGDNIKTLNLEMDEIQDLKTPYAVWYSIDTERGVRALQNTNTTLRSTGKTFRDRMY